MQMRKKQENIISAKVFNEYMGRSKQLTKENKILISQINDHKTNLGINKELLFKYFLNAKNVITGVSGNKSIILDLKEENSYLVSKVEILFSEKREIEKKIYKMQLDIDKRVDEEQEILKRADDDIFILGNKILEKNATVDNLKREIERVINNGTLNIENVKEIHIAMPGRGNLELNNELYYTRVIIQNINIILQENKLKNEQLQISLNVFKNYLFLIDLSKTVR